MKNFTHFTTILAVLALSLLIFPVEADAYLDAGTGSYIIQLIIAAFLGGLCALKIFWGKIKNLYGNLFSRRAKLEKTDD